MKYLPLILGTGGFALCVYAIFLKGKNKPKNMQEVLFLHMFCDKKNKDLSSSLDLDLN